MDRETQKLDECKWMAEIEIRVVSVEACRVRGGKEFIAKKRQDKLVDQLKNIEGI